MRHRHSPNRLRYKPAHSRMLQRNLVTSLFLYESIRTTKKRAEVIQPTIDHLITIVKKKDTVNAIRAINKVLTDDNASRKMLQVLRARFANRQSGFTRMVPLGLRKGDGAELVDLMLMDGDAAAPMMSEPKKAKTLKKTPAKKATSAKKEMATAVVDETSDSSMPS